MFWRTLFTDFRRGSLSSIPLCPAPLGFGRYSCCPSQWARHLSGCRLCCIWHSPLWPLLPWLYSATAINSRCVPSCGECGAHGGCALSGWPGEDRNSDCTLDDEIRWLLSKWSHCVASDCAAWEVCENVGCFQRLGDIYKLFFESCPCSYIVWLYMKLIIRFWIFQNIGLQHDHVFLFYSVIGPQQAYLKRCEARFPVSVPDHTDQQTTVESTNEPDREANGVTEESAGDRSLFESNARSAAAAAALAQQVTTAMARKGLMRRTGTTAPSGGNGGSGGLWIIRNLKLMGVVKLLWCSGFVHFPVLSYCYNPLSFQTIKWT